MYPCSVSCNSASFKKYVLPLPNSPVMHTIRFCSIKSTILSAIPGER
jgi:hypothetical protein